jgi:hypothetical protein
LLKIVLTAPDVALKRLHAWFERLTIQISN